MSRHIDNIHHSHGQEYGYPQVSALLFLNDNYKGGQFIISDVLYKPEQGSAIIFPSNFMFPHEVKTIKNKITTRLKSLYNSYSNLIPKKIECIIRSTAEPVPKKTNLLFL